MTTQTTPTTPTTGEKQRKKRGPNKVKTKLVPCYMEKGADGLRIWKEIATAALPESVRNAESRAAFKASVKATFEGDTKAATAFNGRRLDMIGAADGASFCFTAKIEEVKVQKVSLQES